MNNKANRAALSETFETSLFHILDRPDYAEVSARDYIEALEDALRRVETAVELETDEGFGVYMLNIKRALNGQSSSRKKK